MIILPFLTLLLFAASDDIEIPSLLVHIVFDGESASQNKRYTDAATFEERENNKALDEFIENSIRYSHVESGDLFASTAPNHASIATGATAAYHGIAGQSFRQKVRDPDTGLVNDENVGYAYADPRYTEVTATDPSPEPDNAGTSPFRIRGSTYVEEFLYTYPTSKAVTVSFKDRSAIDMAGHMQKRMDDAPFVNMAFWQERGDLWPHAAGKMISSTYYFPEGAYPAWVDEFNDGVFELGKYYTLTDDNGEVVQVKWEAEGNLETYANYHLSRDHFVEDAYELGSESTDGVFPKYQIKDRNAGEYNNIRGGPSATYIVMDFAMKAVAGEQLGQRGVPDILNILLPGHDALGHRNGETLDKEDIHKKEWRKINELRTLLTSLIPEDKIIWVYSSDHGMGERTATNVELYGLEQSKNVDPFAEWAVSCSARTNPKPVCMAMIKPKAWIYHFNEYLKNEFGLDKDILPYDFVVQKGYWYMTSEYVKGLKFYFNDTGLTLEEIKAIEVIGKDFFSTYPGVKNVLTKNTINPETGLQEKFEKTFDAATAPNLLLIPDQNTYVWVGNKWLFPVSHGVTENGDLTDHMLAFVLPKKKPKAVDEKVKITNIAPTIGKILGFPKPTCAFEDPLKDVVDALID